MEVVNTKIDILMAKIETFKDLLAEEDSDGDSSKKN
jgi:hypothetical protein